MPVMTDADGRAVLNTRTLAVIVGTLSLGFGLWALIGDTAPMGLAAGALGLVAGLVSLLADPPEKLPGDTRRTGTGGSSEPPASSGAQGSAPPTPPEIGRQPGHGVDVAEGAELAGTPLTDPETGLFSENYLTVALESRLASARRHLRPVALALLEVTEGLPDKGPNPAPAATVASAVRNTVRDSDIACRLDDGTFGVILEDTPENGAVWTVERIRRNLVSSSGHHTLWAGVACYPAHAFDGDELMSQVQQALAAAKEWNQDRIEVAIAE